MQRVFLLLFVSSFLLSCNSGNELPIAEEQIQQEEPTPVGIKLIGKWILYEDVDTKGFNDKKSTLIFQENGEVTIVLSAKKQKTGKYEFNEELNTLAIEGESVDVEMIDKDNIRLHGKHRRGKKFVSQLVRQ